MSRLKIDEETSASGALHAIYLVKADDGLAIASEAGTLALPEGALDAMMARYGEPLDEGARTAVVDVLDLGDGRAVRHVRHLATYDVIARDWLVYERAGQDALVVRARTAAAVLGHLARAQSARQ